MSSELDAVKNYNAGIVVCGEANDFATREILEGILKDEDGHVDEIEGVLDELEQIGVQIFLSTQIG